MRARVVNYRRRSPPGLRRGKTWNVEIGGGQLHNPPGMRRLHFEELCSMWRSAASVEVKMCSARVSHVCVYCCVSLWHTWCQGRRSRHCFGPFGDLGSNHWGDKSGETSRSQVIPDFCLLWAYWNCRDVIGTCKSSLWNKGHLHVFCIFCTSLIHTNKRDIRAKQIPG